MIDQSLFYNQLNSHDNSLETLIGRPDLFKDLPADWHVVVVDVENSTQAVKNGLHHDVNLAATGSIIAVLNKLKVQKEKIEIPYFFGGDGATFLVPNNMLKLVFDVLEDYRHHVRHNLYLSLKVGSLPVEKVYQDFGHIKIIKCKVNGVLTIPLVLGNALKKAESKIKSFFIDETEEPKVLEEVNLEGMECRWQEIEPPAKDHKILVLLATCPDDDLQPEVYQSIIKKINNCFGDYKQRHPIATSKLKLDLRMSKMKKEMIARKGKFDIVYLLKNWMITAIGKYYFIYFKEGREYVKKVSELSYILMIDGMINSVISGTQAQIDELVTYLDQLEKENKLQYGVHVTYGSVLSCFIEDRQAKHIHFVDGTEGGFTTAAKMIKKKFA